MKASGCSALSGYVMRSHRNDRRRQTAAAVGVIMSEDEIRLFQPSNGTHGDCFIAGHCERCAKYPHSSDAKNQCMILLRTFAYSITDPEYPREWRYVDGEPTCTAFKDRDEFNAERRAKRKPPRTAVGIDDMFDAAAAEIGKATGE